mmetsp:Transcript_102745/g.257652  ORF Transcript_102745/g.257652 Transcript_102745/m.257652 type:complete len:266 (+) Transcript_102745:114-911(+)
MAEIAVIGAGCGRTGTASLKAALEILLGGKCYHMFELLQAEHEQLWIDAAGGKPDWDTIMKGFKATVDFPGSVFYADLMVKYPSAKVVLSVRSPESWYKSVSETIWNPSGMEHYWAFWIFPSSRLFQRMCKGWRAKILGVPEIPITDKEGIIQAFEAWNEKVKATVPKDRLLVHEAKDGWEPLCKFLGLPVPSEPYPNVNDTADFTKMMVARRNEALKYNAALFAGIGGVVVLVSHKTCKHFGALIATVAAGCLAVMIPKKFRGA